MPATYLKIILFLLVAPLVLILRKPLFKKWGRAGLYGLIILHGLFLTLLSVSFLNMPKLILSDEISVMNHKDYYESDSAREKAYDFVKNNFVLVNTDYDKQLLPKPGETAGDSMYIQVADRSKLIRLFRMLNAAGDNVDGVICDIGFPDATSNDTALHDEMWELSQKKKLLVSVTGEEAKDNFFAFPETIKGDVKEETNEKLFLSHRLRREASYSLPYRAYTSIHHIDTSEPEFFNSFLREKHEDGSHIWVMNTFLPQFFITDESLIRHNFIAPREENPLQEDDMDSTIANSLYYFDMGPALKYNGLVFLANLKQRKLNHQKNFIFLGKFSGNEDLHRTAYTELHGPVILLNLIYALETNQNRLSFSFLLCLFLCYCIVSFALFNGILFKLYENGRNIYPEIPRRKCLERANHKEKKRNRFLEGFLLFLRFVCLEEIQYVFLLILVLVIEKYLGVLINGVSLVLYMVAFEAFAMHFGKSHLSDRQSPQHV